MNNTFSEGDLIEATKTEIASSTRFRGILALLEFANGVKGLILKAQGYEPMLQWLEDQGFEFTLIEKAAPALPTEPGAYLDKDGDMWLLDRNLNWGDFSLMELPPSDHTRTPHSYAPFTRLEPVADTAKKVIDRIASEIDVVNSSDWRFIQLKLSAVATEFGVSS